MDRFKKHIRNGIFVTVTLIIIFFLNILLIRLFSTRSLTPMVFVLGVLLISMYTDGYLWGIASSLISVLAVNYAFTFPYYAFDLITPDNFFSALVMLAVAIITGALTTKIKKQEKVKAEGERERMRANLLRGISHDLRTPLTSIYGSCSAILENYDSLRQEQKLKLLGEIQSDAKWLIRMVENLLSVTRIDTEGVRITKTPAVLEELVDSVLVKFHKNHPEQNVTVEIPDEFISIPMDAMLIEQVLMNLLENAVFHARDMHTITLSVHTNSGNAVFSVADDGCGIAQDRLGNLFSGNLGQGTLADSSRNNMGIGLSVCAAIIKAHGGEIVVENQPGSGAKFSFSLEMEDVPYE